MRRLLALWAGFHSSLAWRVIRNHSPLPDYDIATVATVAINANAKPKVLARNELMPEVDVEEAAVELEGALQLDVPQAVTGSKAAMEEICWVQAETLGAFMKYVTLCPAGHVLLVNPEALFATKLEHGVVYEMQTAPDVTVEAVGGDGTLAPLA